jgi:hypothetical protein
VTTEVDFWFEESVLRTEECFELVAEVRHLEQLLATALSERDLMITAAERCQRQRRTYDKGVTEAWERIDELSTELAAERSRRTTAGVPPGYHAPGAWSNEAIAPPPSATDLNAPPLKRGLS